MRSNRAIRVALGAVLLTALAVPSAAIAAPDAADGPLIPEALTQRHAAAKAKLAPEIVAKLDGIAIALAPSLVGKTKGLQDAVLGELDDLAHMDVMALAQIVMLRCAEQAAADIAVLLAAMKSSNAQTEKLREFTAKTKTHLIARGGEVPTASMKSSAPVAMQSAVLEVEYCLAPDVPVPGPLEALTVAQLQALYSDLLRRGATAKQASKCTRAQLERVRALLRALVLVLESGRKK